SSDLLLGLPEGHPERQPRTGRRHRAVPVPIPAGGSGAGAAGRLPFTGGLTMSGRILRRVGFFLGIGLLGLFAIIPVLWALITVFKASTDLYVFGPNPFLFNDPPTLDHLVILFKNTNFPVFLKNSAIVGVCVVAITVLLSVPAAYALARLTGGWGERSGMAIFLVYLIPPSLLFIPMYRIVVWLGLANTIWSLVVVLPTITIPFCTWLLLGFFRAIPRTQDEAALLDGCGYFAAF